MEFINITKNSVDLKDVNKIIPFLGEHIPQSISSDEIKRSKAFQFMCLSKKFKILTIDDSQIEQNLWNMQNKTYQEPAEPMHVSLYGQFLNNAGFGKANRNLTYSLATAGVKVGVIIEDIDSSELMPQGEIESISRFQINEVSKMHIDSHVPSFAERNPNCTYAILNTTVEAASIPLDFVETCDKFDEIWTVSNFCKDVLLEYGVNKTITVIPNAINTSLYNTKVKPHVFQPPLKGFIFVCVGTWGYRKGQDILLKAFINEFSALDDVTLLFVVNYESNSKSDRIAKEIKAALAIRTDPPAIARCGQSIPEYEMPRVYKACNAFVMPSRGEGFGLPYLEAGSCGLPVISTKHSGQLMFLNEGNSYLVETDGLKECEIGTTDIHYWDGHIFADIDSDAFVSRLQKTMRHVYENQEEAKERASKLANIAENFSLANVGSMAAERLKNIWKTHYSS